MKRTKIDILPTKQKEYSTKSPSGNNPTDQSVLFKEACNRISVLPIEAIQTNALKTFDGSPANPSFAPK